MHCAIVSFKAPFPPVANYACFCHILAVFYSGYEVAVMCLLLHNCDLLLFAWLFAVAMYFEALRCGDKLWTAEHETLWCMVIMTKSLFMLYGGLSDSFQFNKLLCILQELLHTETLFSKLLAHKFLWETAVFRLLTLWLHICCRLFAQTHGALFFTLAHKSELQKQAYVNVLIFFSISCSEAAVVLFGERGCGEDIASFHTMLSASI